MKKKNDDERKPDLNEADDQAEIEARIREMMELEPTPPEPKAAGKSISVTMHEDEAPLSAPVLPEAKKPLSIKIVDHNELTEEPTPESSETFESDPEVLAAIEEANQQLLAKAEPAEEEVAEADEPVTDDAEDTETPEPDEEAEPQETTEEPTATEPSAPELSTDEEEPSEEEVSDEAEEPGDLVESDEDVELEPDEEPEQAPEATDKTAAAKKEKPLKHLDSIVPKNKVEKTIEDTKTEEAVSDIIAKEGDALLKAEDDKNAAAFVPEPKPKFSQRLKGFLSKKSVRWIAFLFLVSIIAVAAVLPNARYAVLNAAGVRSAASLTVLDESTQQPLKGVKVTLANVTAESDQEGKVSFTGLKLGQTNLVVEKRAFAPVTRPIIIGWGSNPLGDFSLAPTGTQYRFVVTDFLSGKPVAKVEAVSNEASAISNEKGEIRLTIDQQDDTPRDIVITGQGYREERFALDLNQKEQIALQLVPARKHVFISNRNGRYDVYKVDADGKNEALVLPGTGSEREDMVLVSHPNEEAVAIVSTRDNKRNKDGFLLSTLTVASLNEQTAKAVVTSERVQIIDWVGTRIVYVQIKEGASGDSPDRHKLVSYDYKSQEFKELGSSNYFNDVQVAGGKVYVAPSSTYSDSTTSSLFRIEADGSNKQTVINKEVWNIFRTSFDKLTLAVQQDWYELRIGELKPGKVSGPPPTQSSRIYIASPDTTRSLWVDTRDGKGVLLMHTTEGNKEDVVRTQGGLKQPVRWLTNSTIVYRINTESETADYVLNLDGGEPKKIRDVTNTSGINAWYYY